MCSITWCPQVQGCPPAMGYSFAAGTTDGPGAFPFSQSIVTVNPLWNTIRNLVYGPSERQKACHHPKPILLTTGEVRDLPSLLFRSLFRQFLNITNSAGVPKLLLSDNYLQTCLRYSSKHRTGPSTVIKLWLTFHWSVDIITKL